MSDNFGTVIGMIVVGLVVASIAFGIFNAVIETHVDTVTSCTTTYVGPVQ